MNTRAPFPPQHNPLSLSLTSSHHNTARSPAHCDPPHMAHGCAVQCKVGISGFVGPSSMRRHCPRHPTETDRALTFIRSKVGEGLIECRTYFPREVGVAAGGG